MKEEEKVIRTNVLLVGGFGDGHLFGTTIRVKNKLKQWARSKGGNIKIKAVYSGGSSIGGQSLRRISSYLRKRLKCSVENPHCGMIYAYSMGSLIVKMGIVEGWIVPSAVLFCGGAHLGIHEKKGNIFETVYTPSDSIRAMVGVKHSAVKSINSMDFTETLDNEFCNWLKGNPRVHVTFVGHTRDELIPIESSVPATYRSRAQVSHHIFEDKSPKFLVHLRFPHTKQCLDIITSFIEEHSLDRTKETAGPSIQGTAESFDKTSCSTADSINKASYSLNRTKETTACSSSIPGIVDSFDKISCSTADNINKASCSTAENIDIEQKHRLNEIRLNKTVALALALIIFGLISFELENCNSGLRRNFSKK
mmetsp:Transcript_12225/g.17923  ORF Transcript_12225/g.17923 Transcript_12225/m.17923 type:complete len:366 (-) Transcript_12225:98-1195(-)